MTSADFRRIALSLEGAQESSHMGAADFRVGGRIFATLAHEAKGAMDDAIDSCNIPGGGGGLMGTMRMLSQKDTQEALRFMLSFSCSLKKRAMLLAKSPTP